MNSIQYNYVTNLELFVGNNDLNGAFTTFFDVLECLDGVFEFISVSNQALQINLFRSQHFNGSGICLNRERMRFKNFHALKRSTYIAVSHHTSDINFSGRDVSYRDRLN